MLTYFICSNYARELISLSGSIVILRKFRPSISFVPSILENKRNRRGPFAPLEPSRPTLLLEIESFEVLGSINEVIFWDTRSLQSSLLSEEFALRNRSFKAWFRQVDKIFSSEERRREKRRQRVANGDASSTPSGSRNAANDTVSNTSAKTRMVSNSAETTSPYVPPPFQRPSSLIKGPHSSKKSKEKEKSQSSTHSLNPWGDFELSMGGDDDFGIAAAASQMLDRHSQGGVGGQEDIDIDIDSFDPLSVSPLGLDTIAESDTAMTDAPKVTASGHAIIDPFSEEANQHSQASNESQRQSKGSSGKESSFASVSFSLPLSMLSTTSSGTNGKKSKSRSDSSLLQEMQGFTTIDSMPDGEEQGESIIQSQSCSGSQPQESMIGIGTQVSDGLGEQARQPSKANGSTLESPSVSVSPGPLEPNDGQETKSKRSWDKYIRRISPEVLKERERTYSSRVNLIVD